jgi:hypothetical protein
MMRPRPWIPVVGMWAWAIVLAGCHTYRPVDTAPLGSVVRVRVPVSSPLSRVVETASIEGQLLDDGDTITLATATRRQLGAFSELMQYDTIRLAPDQVSSFDLKEFSTKRSVLLGVVIATGSFVAAAYGFGLVGGADPADGDGLPPPVARFLSLPWSLGFR